LFCFIYLFSSDLLFNIFILFVNYVYKLSHFGLYCSTIKCFCNLLLAFEMLYWNLWLLLMNIISLKVICVIKVPLVQYFLIVARDLCTPWRLPTPPTNRKKTKISVSCNLISNLNSPLPSFYVFSLVRCTTPLLHPRRYYSLLLHAFYCRALVMGVFFFFNNFFSNHGSPF